MEAEKTDHRFKILYAFAMIMIVSGHCDDGAIDLFYEWIPYMGTHLAILIFASGYFYKDSAEEKPLAFIGKKAKHLLLPMYLWNLFYGVIVALSHRAGFTIGGELTLRNLFLAPLYDGHQFSYNLAGWYVVPLFAAQVLYMSIRKLLSLPRKKSADGNGKQTAAETVTVLVCLGAGILGLSLSILGYHEGWWLLPVRSLYFLAFYAIGVYYRRVLEKYDRLPNLVYFGCIIAAQLLLLFFCHRMPIYVISWCDGFPEGPVVPYLTGMLGIAFWLRIARILEPGLKEDRGLRKIADHSYSIMLHQFAGFMFVKTIYAFLAKYTGHFADFDMVRYKTDLWYYYTPAKLPYYSLIFYLIAGIALPVLLAEACGKIKSMRKSGQK